MGRTVRRRRAARRVDVAGVAALVEANNGILRWLLVDRLHPEGGADSAAENWDRKSAGPRRLRPRGAVLDGDACVGPCREFGSEEPPRTRTGWPTRRPSPTSGPADRVQLRRHRDTTRQGGHGRPGRCADPDRRPRRRAGRGRPGGRVRGVAGFLFHGALSTYEEAAGVDPRPQDRQAPVGGVEDCRPLLAVGPAVPRSASTARHRTGGAPPRRRRRGDADHRPPLSRTTGGRQPVRGRGPAGCTAGRATGSSGPPRHGEDPADCRSCQGRDEGILAGRAPAATQVQGVGVPLALMLHPRDHDDLADLTDDLVAERSRASTPWPGTSSPRAHQPARQCPPDRRRWRAPARLGSSPVPRARPSCRVLVVDLVDPPPEYPSAEAQADAAAVVDALVESYGGQPGTPRVDRRVDSTAPAWSASVTCSRRGAGVKNP